MEKERETGDRGEMGEMDGETENGGGKGKKKEKISGERRARDAREGVKRKELGPRYTGDETRPDEMR